jgi:hypothetical protein
MPTNDLHTLSQHGWQKAEDGTYEHDGHPGHKILLPDGGGWQRYDENGHLIAHSRYNTPLDQHLQGT